MLAMVPLAKSLSEQDRTRLRKVALPPEEFLTTEELMHLLQIKHKQTLYRLIHQGMPFTLSGSAYRFDKSAVIAFLKRASQKKPKSR